MLRRRRSHWKRARRAAAIRIRAGSIAALGLALTLAALLVTLRSVTTPSSVSADSNYPIPNVLSLGATSENSNGSALMPSGVHPGDLAIWHIVYSHTSALTDPPLLQGWKLLNYDRVVGNSRWMGQAIFYRVLDGGEHGVQPLNWSGYVDLSRISVYRGVDSLNPLEGIVVSSGIGGSVRQLPDSTTSGPNRLLTCFGGQTDDAPAFNVSGEAGGDWIERYEQGETNGSNSAFYLNTAKMPEAGTITNALGTSHGYPWLNRCFALVPGEIAPETTPAPRLAVAGQAALGSNGSAVMPAGVQSGQLAIWMMGYNVNNLSAVPAPPSPTGWTLLDYDSHTNGTSHTAAQAVYYRFLDGTEGGQLQSASWSGNVDLARIDVFSGVDPSDPFEGAVSNVGSGTKTLPDVTTSGADRLVVQYGFSTSDSATIVGHTWQVAQATVESYSSKSRTELRLAEKASAGTLAGGTSSGPNYPYIFHAFALRPSYQPDVVAADFSSPDEVIPADSAIRFSDEIEVAWDEHVAVATRSVQRQVATAASYDGCLGATWADDGSATTSVSPVQQTGLLDDRCYRWRLTLTDTDGLTWVVTSGTVYITDSGLQLFAAPTAAVGETVYLAAVLEDRSGDPIDTFAGTLTVSTDDDDAIFPEGASYTMAGPQDQAGHTFRMLFGEPGTYTVSVRGPGPAPASVTIEVSPSTLAASAPAQVYKGVPFRMDIVPRTTSGSIATQYAAKVYLTSSDSTATWGPDVSGSPPYKQFVCACEAGDAVHPALSTLGTQTISVTDQFGTSDTVTVEVLDVPGTTVANPVSRADVVQWRHGDTVDWYITARADAAPFQILYDYHTCDTAVNPINLYVDPAVDRYVEFSTKLEDGGICWNDYLDEKSGHYLLITDGLGHQWTMSRSSRVYRFDDLPNASQHRMLDPGDPIASMTVVARPAGSDYVALPGKRALRGEMTVDFVNHEDATLQELYIGRPGVMAYMTSREFQVTGLTGGRTNTAQLTNFTHSCYFDNFTSMNSGWLLYSGGDGRTGAFAAGGGFISQPTTAPPGNELCDVAPSESDGVVREIDSWLDDLNPLNFTGEGGVFDRILEADPVDPLTGAFTQPVTDFDLGGNGPALRLQRTYRSDRAEAFAAGETNASGPFGPGWGSNLGQRLAVDGDRITFVGPDLGYAVFVDDGAGGYRAESPSTLSLSAVSGGYRLESKGGSATVFDSAGRLMAFEGATGRQMTLAYDTNSRLDAITDAAGRTADVTTDGAGRVTRVDLPDGRYVAFTYDANGHLATSRDMAGMVLTFVADGRGRITAIRNADGDALLRNSYDGAGRVVQQRDAAGSTTYFTYNAAGRVSQVIDPRAAVTTSCYSERGQLIARQNALGGIARWTYGAGGQVASATDLLGETSNYVWEGDLLVEATDPLGRIVSFDYGADGRLLTATDADGSTLEVTYTAAGLPETVARHTPAGAPDPNSFVEAAVTYLANGLPASVTGPGGVGTTTTTFDSRGYPTSVTDPIDGVTTFTVDARGFVTAAVDPLGNAPGGVPAEHTSTATYDDMGRVLTSTNVEGETVTYTYNPLGRLTSIESPLGFLTTNEYDLDGRLLGTTTELNAATSATTTFEYDPSGNLTAMIDPEQRRTEYQHDLLGRRVLTRDPNGKEWTTEYDAAGRVVSSSDPTGRTTSTEYDAVGRVVATTDAAGETTTYEYDERDLLVSTTDPLQHTTTYTYDWLGRLETVTNPEDEAVTYAYDAGGRVASVTDNADQTTSFEYNAAGLLTTVIDAELGEATLAYDDAGRLISRTNPRGKTELFEYDNAGRPTKTIDAVGNEWITAYDAGGRVEHTIDANGQQTSFTLDRAGRVLAVTPATSSEAVSFVYDDSGRVQSMTDEAGTTAYTYDGVGLLTSVSRGGRTVGYAYDDAGRIAGVTYPGGTDSAAYAYDAAGRLETITDWDARTHTYAYDDASRVTGIGGPNGVSTSFGYDLADRPTSIVHAQNGSPLLSLAYTYDAAGNVATYSDDAGTTTFGYDALNRLTSADLPGTADDVSYEYDAAGNLVELARSGQPTLARTYDDADRLVSEDDGSGPRTLTYDDNGNLLDDGAGRTFNYDSLSRLVGIDTAGLTVSYTLDGVGNRLAATVDATTTTYDLDVRGLATVLGDGTRRFLPGAPAAGYEQGGTWFSGLTNAQGSLLGSADTGGLVGSLRHFDAWGQPLAGAAPVGPGYTGEWSDETGLVNLRFRAYDPTLHRFLGRDTYPGTANVPTTWNRFAYANANPLTFSDPTGHFGVARLAVSFGLQSVYGIGDLYSGLTGLVGTDWIAGYDLSDGDRILAAGAVLPGPALHVLNRLRDVVQSGVDAVRGSRLAAAAGDLAATLRRSTLAGDSASAARALGSDGGRALRSIAEPGRRMGSGVTRAAPEAAIPSGFDSPREFGEFGRELRGGLAGGGFSDARAAFQGSSVTGRSFRTGAPFDVGRVSDFDIALGGEDIFSAARRAGIGLRGGGIRTGPLTALDLERLGLTGLRANMSDLAGRPVNFMIYRSIEDALARSPSIVVP